MTLREFLDHYRVSLRESGSHHHVRDGWLGVDCPYCSPNSDRFRLGFNLYHHYASCWSCGYVRYFDALSELTGVPWTEIQSLLEYEIPVQTVRARGRLCPPRGLGPLLPLHRDYLRTRGYLPDQLASQWHLGGIGLAARLAWRIYIPVHYKGQIVSWTTRAVVDEIRSRYISAAPHEESEPHHQLLYGEDHVRHAVIVCEGPFDVFRIGPGAVAVLGLAYSREQVLKLSRYPIRVVTFDATADAQRRASRLCHDLACFPGKTFRVELSGADPGSTSEDEIKELRERFLE